MLVSRLPVACLDQAALADVLPEPAAGVTGADAALGVAAAAAGEELLFLLELPVLPVLPALLVAASAAGASAAGLDSEPLASAAPAAASDGFFWPSRKSVTYQPDPFKTNPGAVSCLENWGCPQLGQSVSGASESFCSTSFLNPQAPQA